MQRWLIQTMPLILCGFFWLGCTTQPPIPPSESRQEFFHPSASLTYHALGKILLATHEEKQSGDLEFLLSPQPELRLQIFAPVIGSLLYELRANRAQFLILDFQKNSYVQEINQFFTREQWLGMDLTLQEFGWIVWGRMSQAEFQAAQGSWLASKQFRLQQGDAEFQGTLAANGLLQSLTKSNPNGIVYQVTVASYTTGESIFPQKIQIVPPESQNKIVLFMNTITPQEQSFLKLSFEPPTEMQPWNEASSP